MFVAGHLWTQSDSNSLQNNIGKRTPVVQPKRIEVDDTRKQNEFIMYGQNKTEDNTYNI